MDVLSAINRRHSVRYFKPDPVPQELLKKIVEGALRAPSASNSQPWEFAIVSGPKLEAIKSAYIESSTTMPALDVPIPFTYPEPWISRRSAVMSGVLDKMGVARDDKKARAEWGQWGFKLWGAPSCIYIMVDSAFHHADNGTNMWNLFDCGLVTQSILLLATAEGLGSIPAIIPVLYPGIQRKVLDLPASKLMVLGIPIGYEDEKHPSNQFRTAREPLDRVARFYS